jgi:hypothetical protein
MAEHFRTVAVTAGLRYYVEGVDEQESADFQNDSSLFKMDGPVAHQGSNGVEWYSVEMMILLTDIIQLTGDNAYSIYEWAGAFQASMLNDALAIYRYGSGGQDDQKLIGCLEPDPDVRNNVRVVSYGQVDKDLRIKQVSINGRFVLHPL